MKPLNDYQHINGWLLAPASYLVVMFVAACGMFILYVLKFFDLYSAYGAWPSFLPLSWYLSLATTLLMGLFTAHVIKLMFFRARKFPRMFIIWLMISLVLGLKTFAFSPIDDTMALKVLLCPLFAASLFVPYMKRSYRVKMTFTQDR